MATINVTNSTELYAAVRIAKAGDTIQLETGTYSNVQLSGIKIDGDVTITSRDPDKPAVLTDIHIRDSSGLSFSKLEFSIEYARGTDPMKVVNSQNIHFQDINVHGSVDGIATNDTSAMQIRNSTDVSIEDSEFNDLANAVTHLDSDGVVFSGNYFHDIRMDAIRGGGTSNLTVENNYFTNFRPAAGDHGDAIQVWNSNTTTAAKNILIRENVIVQGDGGAVQGIFVTAQITKLLYQNVQISDNLIVGGLTNAITVNGADGVKIDGNVAAAVGSKIWIRMTDIVNVTLTDNTANDYYKAGAYVAVEEAGNTKVPVQSDGGLALLKQWLAGRGDMPDVLDAMTGGQIPDGDQSVVTPPLNPLPIPPAEVVTPPSSGAGVDSPVGQVLADGEANLVLGRTGDLDATGNAMNNVIVGNAGSNHILGGAGNDTIDGGAYGRDILEGGSGDDTYIVGPSVTIIEEADAGVDTVQSMYFVTLSENVENLEIIGRGGASGTGNELANRITGNVGNNVLSGLGGNDTINGGNGKDVIIGGAGDDVLIGGPGGDYFEFRRGSGNDVISDFGGSGDREGINFMYYVKAGAVVTVTEEEQGAVIHFDAHNSVLLTGVHAADLVNTGNAFFIN